MALILLAIALTIAACVIAYYLAVYALPVMAGISAAQFAWGAGAGVLMSGLAAIAAAVLSVAFVILVLGFAKNPALRLAALALFALPATSAGYALVYGITKNAVDSGLALNLLGGVAGLIIGVSAIANLSALGTSVFSR